MQGCFARHTRTAYEPVAHIHGEGCHLRHYSYSVHIPHVVHNHRRYRILPHRRHYKKGKRIYKRNYRRHHRHHH